MSYEITTHFSRIKSQQNYLLVVNKDLVLLGSFVTLSKHKAK